MQNEKVVEESLFDARADGWDTPQRMSLATGVTEAIFRAIDVNNTMQVLEFGSGTGLITLALAGRAGRMLAVDSSRAMIEVLKRKIREGSFNNIETHLGEIDPDDARQGNRDLIVSSMTLHHVENTQALFANLHRLLRAGGRIALADLEREEGDFHEDNTGVEHFGFDTDALVRWTQEAGFREVAFSRAHVVRKVREGGKEKEYPVFLLTAVKGP